MSNMSNQKKGKFIVFDGIDGSGKGTLAKLLVKHLFDSDKKNHVLLTREPYNSKYYAEIRQLLKEGADPTDNAELLTELFVKDRLVHTNLIAHFLSEGVHVVCDRYKYSTFAYQKAQGISLDKLIQMHGDILVPDMTLIVDVSVDEALGRVEKDGNRSHKEVFEQKDFQEKLRQNFLTLPAILPNEKIVIINGMGTIREVFGLVKKETGKIL